MCTGSWKGSGAVGRGKVGHVGGHGCCVSTDGEWVQAASATAHEAPTHIHTLLLELHCHVRESLHGVRAHRSHDCPPRSDGAVGHPLLSSTASRRRGWGSGPGLQSVRPSSLSTIALLTRACWSVPNGRAWRSATSVSFWFLPPHRGARARVRT